MGLRKFDSFLYIFFSPDHCVDYVVQGHRFNILEDIGCYPVIYNTLPAYFLVFMWPPLLGCVSFIYSGKCLFIVILIF
jgi:Pheromone A receptor